MYHRPQDVNNWRNFVFFNRFFFSCKPKTASKSQLMKITGNRCQAETTGVQAAVGAHSKNSLRP
jgi:hypothetical protein